MIPLLHIFGFGFVSQYGNGKIKFGNEFRNFYRVNLLCEQLALVICVNSQLMHLATRKIRIMCYLDIKPIIVGQSVLKDSLIVTI